MQARLPKRKALSLKTATFALTLSFLLLFTIVLSVAFYSLASYQIHQTVQDNAVNHILNVSNLLEHQFEQLLMQLNSLVQSNEFARLHYSVYYDEQPRPGSFIKLSNKLAAFYSQNSEMLESVYLYLDNNAILQYYSDNFLKSIKLPFDELYALYGSDTLLWTGHEAPDAFETIYPRERVLRLMFLLGKPETKRHGIFSVGIKASYFDELLRTQSVTSGSFVALAQGDSYLLKNKQNSLNSAQISALRAQKPAKGAAAYLETKEFIAYYMPLSVQSLGLLITIPAQEFHLQLNRFTMLVPLAAGLVLIIGLLIYTQLSRLMTRPIDKITKKMALVGEGHLDTKFDVSGVEEINIINDNAQQMTQSISRLVQNVYQEQKSKRQAELNALQAQINPHFLYNTLYAARQLCEMHENDNAIQMLDDLSVFYRIGISRGKGSIPLSEELQHVKSYLSILKMRYEEDFDYEIAVAQEFMDCVILKLTLQPLVENAVQHGILPRRAHGNILIEAENQGDDLLVHVTDDGVGIDAEKLQSINAQLDDFSSNVTSYGLKNVHQRLKLTFGDSYGLQISSKNGCGLTATVRIPLCLEKEDGNDTHPIR